MTTWKFVETEEDGETWMRNPVEFHTFIDFGPDSAGGDGSWRRIMVVTRSWLEREIRNVRVAATGAGRAVFAPMIVLPDASPAELRTFIDAAVGAGGLEHFASTVTDR